MSYTLRQAAAGVSPRSIGGSTIESDTIDSDQNASFAGGAFNGRFRPKTRPFSLSVTIPKPAVRAIIKKGAGECCCGAPLTLGSLPASSDQG